MTEAADNCPPPGVLNTPNNDNAENYFYTSANLYFGQQSAPHFYEKREGLDVSQLPEVDATGSSSAFKPVNPGEGLLGRDLFLKGPLQSHFRHTETNMKGGKKYNSRYPLPEKPRQKRAVIQDMVRPLKQWLVRHRHNPYPTKTEKVQLALGSNMTLVQVSNWFANARRRLKNVVQDHRCSWSKRLRMYNQFVQGNAELLSIASDDSIWHSEDEEDCDSSSIRKTEADSCGRTPVSSADGNEDGLRSPGKDGSPKYKTSILHRYLADSLESAAAAATTGNSTPSPAYLGHHLPIRPLPSKDERLYKPYRRVFRDKRVSESTSQRGEDEEDLVVVDDEDGEDLSKEEKETPGGLRPPHLPHSFPLWHHHHPFPLANPLFSPFLASSAHKDLLKLLYNDALISRSKDLAAMGPHHALGPGLPQEPISAPSLAPPNFPSIPPGHHPQPPSVLSSTSPNELLNKIPSSQTPSSTPAIFI